MRNPATNLDINKKISAMNYYAYRTMIHSYIQSKLKSKHYIQNFLYPELSYIQNFSTYIKLHSEDYIPFYNVVLN